MNTLALAQTQLLAQTHTLVSVHHVERDFTTEDHLTGVHDTPESKPIRRRYSDHLTPHMLEYTHLMCE